MRDELTQIQVLRSAKSLARRTFRGNRSTLKSKEKHIENVAIAIYERWRIGPHDWQAKHIRWLLERHLASRSRGTKYRYFLIIRKVLIELNKWLNFKPYLDGSWTSPKVLI
ncbi:MAG: hypothetical protein ACJAS1_004500 [Oleiphilaceae bacterium]|jgi:hypothetical protein